MIELSPNLLAPALPGMPVSGVDPSGGGDSAPAFDGLLSELLAPAGDAAAAPTLPVARQALAGGGKDMPVGGPALAVIDPGPPAASATIESTAPIADDDSGTEPALTWLLPPQKIKLLVGTAAPVPDPAAEPARIGIRTDPAVPRADTPLSTAATLRASAAAILAPAPEWTSTPDTEQPAGGTVAVAIPTAAPQIPGDGEATQARVSNHAPAALANDQGDQVRKPLVEAPDPDLCDARGRHLAVKQFPPVAIAGEVPIVLDPDTDAEPGAPDSRSVAGPTNEPVDTTEPAPTNEIPVGAALTPPITLAPVAVEPTARSPKAELMASPPSARFADPVAAPTLAGVTAAPTPDAGVQLQDRTPPIAPPGPAEAMSAVTTLPGAAPKPAGPGVVPPASSPVAATIQRPPVAQPFAVDSAVVSVREMVTLAAPRAEGPVQPITVPGVQPVPQVGTVPVAAAASAAAMVAQPESPVAPRAAVRDGERRQLAPAGVTAADSRAPTLAPVTAANADAPSHDEQPLPVRPLAFEVAVQQAAAPAPTVALRPAEPMAQSPATGIDLTHAAGLHRMIDHIEALRDAAPVDLAAASTRIRLVPDALGPVDVAVRREGDSVQVHFTATEAATRQLIADAQPRLAELAEARGVRIERATVDSGAAGQPSMQFSQQSQGNGHAQGHAQPQRHPTANPASLFRARTDRAAEAAPTEQRIA
jgi:Meckel syndrome type 1 protein